MLFPHAHIVNGVAIVHSHPYISACGDKQASHEHTAEGYVLIHLLSHFLTTVLFLSISVGAAITVLRKSIFPKDVERIAGALFLYSNGLRSPSHS